MKESELAEKFIDYFDDQFEIYKEVPVYSGIADIVAVNKIAPRFRIIIEVKKSFSLELIGQAISRIRHANYVYVAVPDSKSISTISPAYNICKDYGIGILIYMEKKYMYREGSRSEIKEYLKPKFFRQANTIKLQEWMKQSIAGSQNDRMTYFKASVQEVTEYIRRKGGKVLIQEVLDNTKYHWSSPKSAKTCIYQWCRAGVIKEFKQEGKFYILNDEKTKTDTI